MDDPRNKPNFGLVAALFAITILVIAVAATLVVSWRAKSAQKTPFTRHPLSLLTAPERTESSLA